MICMLFVSRDAAMAILSHRDWKLALRNKTLDEDKNLTTPIRKMVRRMPGNCFKTTGCPSKSYLELYKPILSQIVTKFLHNVKMIL